MPAYNFKINNTARGFIVSSLFYQNQFKLKSTISCEKSIQHHRVKKQD